MENDVSFFSFPPLAAGALTLPAMFALTLGVSACGGSSLDEAATVAGYTAKCGLPDAASEKYRVTTPTGSSCVGAIIAYAEDASRKDVLGPDPERARSVQLRVWYPAVHAKGLERMPYSSDLVYAAQGWPDPAAKPNGNALRNAPVADGRRYPVLLFSPGAGFAVDAYAAMAEDLASHGYIVVGINHPLMSGPVAFPDGRVVPDSQDLTLDTLPALAQMMVDDQRFVLTWLQQHQNDRSLPFAASMDLGRVGSYGHSVGGSAALQTERVDPRVKAAVNMDGTIWGDLSTPWTKPWMILYADHDPDPSYALFAANPQPGSLMVPVPKAGHHDFSDLPRWVAAFKKAQPTAELPPNDVLHPDPDSLERRLRGDLRGFFDKHVR